MSPSIFGQWMLYLPGAIEGLAAVLIGLASLETTVLIAGLFIHRRVTGAAKEGIRLRLGMWLSLALELEIAADICGQPLHRAGTRSERLPPSSSRSEPS